MKNQISHCLLCEGSLRNWIEKEGRQILKCTSCDLFHVAQGEAIGQEGQTIYEGEQNVFFQDGNENYYLDETNFLACKAKFDWMKKFSEEKSVLLDAGASFGHFLEVVKNYYVGNGFDVSPDAVAWSLKNFNVKNEVGSVYQLPAQWNESYDAVTFWDTIEHLEDPRLALKSLSKVLKPNGLLFLSTPDTGSLAAKVWSKNWYYLDPAQHITIFNRNNIRALLSQENFEIIQIKSIGRHYRIQYVFDRLYKVAGNKALKFFAFLGGKLPQCILKKDIYLHFGDVLCLVARKK